MHDEIIRRSLRSRAAPVLVLEESDGWLGDHILVPVLHAGADTRKLEVGPLPAWEDAGARVCHNQAADHSKACCPVRRRGHAQAGGGAAHRVGDAGARV